jgi:hypothetical protein
MQLGAIDCARHGALEGDAPEGSLPPSAVARADDSGAGDAGVEASDGADAGMADAGVPKSPLSLSLSGLSIGKSPIKAGHPISIHDTNCGAPGGPPTNTGQAPKGAVALSPAVVTSGAIPNLDQALAGARPVFHACYLMALRNNPSESGTATFALSLGADQVVTASVVTANGVSSATSTCIIRKIRNMELPAQGPAAARVDMSFKPL